MQEVLHEVMALVEQLESCALALDDKGTIVWASGSLIERYEHSGLCGHPFKLLFEAREDHTVLRGHIRYECLTRNLTLAGQAFIVVVLHELQRLSSPGSRQYTLNQILSAVDNGVIVSDYEGRIIYYNAALEQQEGLRAEDTVGKYIWDVYRYNDYKKSEHRTVFHSGIPIENCFRAHSHENNISHYLSYSTYPLIYKNTKLGVFSVCKNETGLRSLLTKTIDQKRKYMQNQPGIHTKKMYPNGTSYTFVDIVGTSSCTENLIREAQSIAFLDNNVLVIGETGTGKEVYVQSMHNLCKTDRPFIGVNCAAIPENLFESILFGSTKGAYTGAQDSLGLFEKAGEGTIFLDELNSMPHPLQSKLLRALQERSIRRVGGLDAIPLRCRFISAVNADPLQLIAGGALRQDLFYRIAAICLYIEPLRNRKEDMDALATEFIAKYNEHMGKRVEGLSEALKKRLYQYSWPGNVREFEHLIENMMVHSHADSTLLDLEDIPPYLLRTMDAAADTTPPETPEGTLPDVLASLERRMILESLRKTGWNVSRSARDLGIIRQSLLYRIKKLGIGKGDEIP